MTSWSRRPGVLAVGGARFERPTRWALEDLTVAPPEPVEEVEEVPVEPAEPVKDAAEWEREIEEAYARGVAEGLERGRAEGRQEEAERLADALRAVHAAVDGVKATESQWKASLEEHLTVLAIAIARHIIGREVRTDANVIADMVRRAITDFPIDQPLRIRVNPRDLSMISAMPAPGASPVPIAPGRNLQWLADPRIESGGCVVEGRDRIVDGRVDRALERIYWELKSDD